MKVVENRGGIAVTNAFLIADETTGKAVIFDAPNDTVAPLLAEAEKNHWDVIGLWLTHGHFDHTADHALVTAKFPNAKVLMHELDQPKLENPTSRFFTLPFTIPPRKADELVHDGQELSIGSLKVQVLYTPGHSPGHVMFYFPQENVLVGGDLIIMGAVGRTDLPDSNPADLMKSIRRVMKLPLQTTLLPGHGDVSTLADEAESNPYVQDAMRE